MSDLSHVGTEELRAELRRRRPPRPARILATCHRCGNKLVHTGNNLSPYDEARQVNWFHHAHLKCPATYMGGGI